MRHSNKGFTLIELLVTMAIIGILAAIAVPQFVAYRKRSFDGRTLSDIRNAANAEEAYYADFRKYVSCTGKSQCESTLPSFRGSRDVNISLSEIPASGGVSEHFTGSAYHDKGSRTSGNPYIWDSNAGGLQP